MKHTMAERRAVAAATKHQNTSVLLYAVLSNIGTFVGQHSIQQNHTDSRRTVAKWAWKDA
jgi:hypothetical protein